MPSKEVKRLARNLDRPASDRVVTLAQARTAALETLERAEQERSVTVATGPMTAEEARTATDEAKEIAEDLWRRLYVLHEREAWRALGYESWAGYLATEFDMTKRRANQLVAHARIVLAIEDQVGTTVPFSEQPTEGATRAMSSDTKAIAKVKRMVRRGVSPKAAVDKVTGAICEHPRTVSVVVCADCGKRVE